MILLTDSAKTCKITVSTSLASDLVVSINNYKLCKFPSCSSIKADFNDRIKVVSSIWCSSHSDTGITSWLIWYWFMRLRQSLILLLRRWKAPYIP